MKREEVIRELDTLILKAEKLTEDMRVGQAKGEKRPMISTVGYIELLMSSMTVMRYLEADVHYRYCERLLDPSVEGHAIPQTVIGLLQSCKAQLLAGFLLRSRVLATADVMNDVLEQAEELLANDYKDAACVLIGGALETTLNKMLEQSGYEGDLSKVMLKQKNEMLLKRDKYDKVTHGQIVAWADLRNDAAHGNYAAVRKEQVSDFLKFARDFIMRWYAPKLT